MLDFPISELELIGSRLQWFMQDGATPHYGFQVHNCPNKNFLNWIDREDQWNGSPRLPDLKSLNFAVWGCGTPNLRFIQSRLEIKLTCICAFKMSIVL